MEEAFKQTISQLASDLANILLDRNNWKLQAESLSKQLLEAGLQQAKQLEELQTQVSTLQEHAAELEHRLDSIKNV